MDSNSADFEVKKVEDRNAPYNEVGLNFGVTIFIPKEANSKIKDFCDELKGGYKVISDVYGRVVQS